VAEVEVEIGCPNCGATSKVPFRAISIRCPYCSTPLLGTFFNPAKPPALIPFRLTGKEAYQRGVEFLRKGFFIYRAFKREFQKFKEVKGFYFPLWLYNLQCQVQYRGERGIVTYEWVEVNGQMERRERVDWYPVAGELELQFKNVSYLALREKPLEQVYISQLHWNLPSAVQFQWEPLLGSEGYEYQLNSEIGLKRAQSSLEGRIRSAIRRDIGGDRQRILGYSTRWFNIEQSYLLVPVFHFSVKWRGKEYNVYINGESGEVTGERPVDKLLVGLVILGVAIVIGLIYYFYYKTTQGG
jgi:DNA-directed RNA polymerase subunit RPC12/RpoP